MAQPSTAPRLLALAPARSTLLLFTAPLVVVTLARATPLPAEFTLVAWPALAAALLLDTALFNEFGVAVGDAGFWALFVACCYLQAVLLVTLGRAVRRARAARRRSRTT